MMAKISARGDRETHRWSRAGGATLVLTEQGRLLEKLDRRDGYSLRKPRGAKRWTVQAAGAQAAMLGYEQTTTRR